MRKKVLIWSESIHDVKSGRLVGGLGVQLLHWANQFKQSGYDVYALTPGAKRTEDGITYLANAKRKYISFFLEIYNLVRYLLSFRPEILIARGASRVNFWLTFLSQVTQTKFVFFAASDTDFVQGRELITSRFYRWMHRFSLRYMKYLVVQNDRQAELAKQAAPQSRVIKIPNVWPCVHKRDCNKNIDCLWVANFRRLKRPEWFIRLAQEYPHLSFVMAGASLDQQLYEECKEKASRCPNLDFLGGISLTQSDGLFARSRCFVCSSEIEGFPNTFLQAWSNEIPVITSFDPSNLVASKKLGLAVRTYEEMRDSISSIFNDEELYNQIVAEVRTYFHMSHNPEQQITRLEHLIEK